MNNNDVIMSQKPYLVRAMYEWILDFGYTPRLVICPLVTNVTIPIHLSNQNQITLDISPQAINGLMLGNDTVTFEAYFDRQPYEVILPMNCIGAIIAKEKEVGYVFDIDDFIPQKAIRDLQTRVEESAVQHEQSKNVTKQSNTSKTQEKKSTKKSNLKEKHKSKKDTKKGVSLLSFGKKTSKLRKAQRDSAEKSQKKKDKKMNFLSSLRKKIHV